jgi:catechol 2,3-dioxygenase-like lactoylglutathione lyase family enzyme
MNDSERQMILDHIGITVASYAKSRAFYVKALGPLGIEVVMEVEGWGGMGRSGKPEFWFGPGERATSPIHIAFAANSRAEVRAFYEAAMAAGGRDNGPPGLRPVYHPNYYGAFVLDPDGHNVEAVCHRPE